MYRNLNTRVPPRLETVNQSTLPTLTNKQDKNSFGLCHLSVTCPIQAQCLRLRKPAWNTLTTTPLPFSHRSLSGPFSHGASRVCWTLMLERLQSLSVDQTSVQSSVTTGGWNHQVWRWSRGEFILHTPRPSSPAGRSLYTNSLGLEGIMTLKHFGS